MGAEKVAAGGEESELLDSAAAFIQEALAPETSHSLGEASAPKTQKEKREERGMSKTAKATKTPVLELQNDDKDRQLTRILKTARAQTGIEKKKVLKAQAHASAADKESKLARAAAKHVEKQLKDEEARIKKSVGKVKLPAEVKKRLDKLKAEAQDRLKKAEAAEAKTQKAYDVLQV